MKITPFFINFDYSLCLEQKKSSPDLIREGQYSEYHSCI